MGGKNAAIHGALESLKQDHANLKSDEISPLRNGMSRIQTFAKGRTRVGSECCECCALACTWTCVLGVGGGVCVYVLDVFVRACLSDH